jgi:hypothetical protein
LAKATRPRKEPPREWPRWLRLSTIATVAGIYAVAGPLISSWLGGFERADHAKQEVAKIYRLIAGISRNLAWNSAAAIKTERTVAGNRATDCDIKVDRGEKLTDLERQSCKRWREEEADANVRYQKAFDAATEASNALKPIEKKQAAVAAPPKEADE